MKKNRLSVSFLVVAVGGMNSSECAVVKAAHFGVRFSAIKKCYAMSMIAGIGLSCIFQPRSLFS
jgi:branched-subunit amino acid ABC-type transport system permease component